MAWSVVQSNGANHSASQSTLTYLSNVSSGTKLTCLVVTETTTVTAVKDGAGNSMTQVALIGNAGNVANGTTSLWAMDTPAGDVGTTPTLTITGGGTFNSMVIQEVSGLAVGNTLAAMIDGTAATSSGINTGQATVAAGAYSSTALNEYLVACFGDDSNVNNSTITGVTGSTTYTIDSHSQEANGAANATLSYGNSTNGAETATFAVSNGTSNEWATIFVAFKLAPAGGGVNGTVQPRATIQPRRTSARGVWGGVRGPAFVAVAAPPLLRPVPRRRAARAVWAGSKPFPGFVSVAAPPQEPRTLPRRYPARAVWRGSAPFTGFVAVAAPPRLPPVPRRYPARAVWAGLAVPPRIGTAPRQLPPVPRRTAARAVIRFTPVATTNAAPVVPTVAGALPIVTVNRTEVMSRVTGRVVRR